MSDRHPLGADGVDQPPRRLLGGGLPVAVANEMAMGGATAPPNDTIDLARTCGGDHRTVTYGGVGRYVLVMRPCSSARSSVPTSASQARKPATGPRSAKITLPVGWTPAGTAHPSDGFLRQCSSTASNVGNGSAVGFNESRSIGCGLTDAMWSSDAAGLHDDAAEQVAGLVFNRSAGA